jgi:hypothetical protein
MNGMAETDKTTITYSLCLELERAHRLAPSFFYSRLLPECRDVAQVVPTTAYQIARFSFPFQSTLCEVLGNDPDVGTRGVLMQFETPIRQPLLQVEKTLPAGLVVVIDALDECVGRSGI